MLSVERLVTVRDHSGELMPMFADTCVLFERAGRHYIKVTRMGDAEEPDVSVCLLPVLVTETPTMTRWVRIANSEILKP